ncbi:MAG: hypothetical protein ACTSR8_01875 [Promethearchaeota archaeon]
MIDSKDALGEDSIEISLPLADNSLQFISVKGWDGQVLKMSVEKAREMLENYMRILITDELRRDKKFAKKIIELNAQLKRYTEFGVVCILWENNKGGNVLIKESPTIEEVKYIDFTKAPFNTLTELMIISKKNQFNLSLRSAVEGKLLDSLLDSPNFKLLNPKKDIDEKINYSKHQFNDLIVRSYYKNIKSILNCLGMDLLL